MKRGALKSYRFATSQQWKACLFARADASALGAGTGVRPLATYERKGTLFESDGAYAPAATRDNTLFWRSEKGGLYRFTACDEGPVCSPAPPSIARARRLIATAQDLWVVSERKTELERYHPESLSRLLAFEVPGDVVDLADGGKGTVLALMRRNQQWQAVHYDRSGHELGSVELQGLGEEVKAYTYLPGSGRHVVLTGGWHPQLFWFATEGGPPLCSAAVGGVRPCFQADVLGGNSTSQVFLGGKEITRDNKARPYVVIFDADGNLLGDVPFEDGEVTGVTGSRDALYVTGPKGLRRFAAATVVPEGAAPVECTVVTPVLFSPDRQDRRRWLRVEAKATVPDGCTLEIVWAATRPKTADDNDAPDEEDTRRRLERTAGDRAIPASHRLERVLAEPDLCRGKTVFPAGPAAEQQRERTFAAKLFGVQGRYLVAGVKLTAAARAALPVLSELTVYYPGRSLMEDLPQIYQEEEARTDSFLRAFVGVLETTSQGLDERIASLGRLIHPSSADGKWQDFVARWLGVPWDDALTRDQKRNILGRAADLARGRGTRAGVEALLEAVMPGSRRRFRVTDLTADCGFAVVGGGDCAGSALPAMLAAKSRSDATLDGGLLLGYTHLPALGRHDDGVAHLAGRIQVEVAATAEERQAWEPWLLTMITDLVPLTAQVDLAWVAPQALRVYRLDDTLVLEPEPAPRLGTDAVVGRTRLPERPPVLSDVGPRIDTDLRT